MSKSSEPKRYHTKAPEGFVDKPHFKDRQTFREYWSNLTNGELNVGMYTEGNKQYYEAVKKNGKIFYTQKGRVWDLSSKDAEERSLKWTMFVADKELREKIEREKPFELHESA